MPTPGPPIFNGPTEEFGQMLQRVSSRQAEGPSILAQLEALRQDIAQLRADLVPQPSFIINGPEALRVFAHLQRGVR